MQVLWHGLAIVAIVVNVYTIRINVNVHTIDTLPLLQSYFSHTMTPLYNSGYFETLFCYVIAEYIIVNTFSRQLLSKKIRKFCKSFCNLVIIWTEIWYYVVKVFTDEQHQPWQFAMTESYCITFKLCEWEVGISCGLISHVKSVRF